MSNGSARASGPWTAIVLAFALTTILYGVVGYLLTTSGGRPRALASLPALRWAFYLAGAAALGIGVLLFSRAASEKLTPGAFQVRSVVSLALCESAAILGLVLVILGGTLSDYLPAGIAVFLVIVLYIYPAGLGYWRRFEGGAGAIRR